MGCKFVDARTPAGDEGLVMLWNVPRLFLLALARSEDGRYRRLRHRCRDGGGARGAAIGAIVATFPVAAGPAYVFVALDHDFAFIAASAIGSIAAHAATAVFSLVYIVLAQRNGTAVSVGGAVLVWFIVAFLLRSVPWTFLTVAAAILRSSASASR